VSLGGAKVGVQAMAGGEVEAGVTGTATFTFAFDPQNAADMKTMAAIPGVIGSLGIADLVAPNQDDAALSKHLVSFEGTGGLYAQGNAFAKVQAGVLTAPQGASGLVGAVTRNPFVASKLKNANLSLFQGSAAIGGETDLGVKIDYRTGNVTYEFKTDAAANASIGTIGMRATQQADDNRKVLVTYDSAGNLVGAKIQTDVSADNFKGYSSTYQDVFGRAMQPGMFAQIQHGDTVRVTYDVRPDMLAQLGPQLASSPDQRSAAVAQLAAIPLNKDSVQLSQAGLVNLHTSTLELGGAMNVNFGAQISIRGDLKLTDTKEADLAP
ncbi:MAG: hypothetical protein KGR26_05480, partial [Cyanobacteria bacterium REEB65]|nr:hypothetical protein [Cyanobacteria bacterium REEB65]